MNNAVIIPARMNSSRFPGKPLIDIMGIPMVIHVWLRSKLSKNINEVYIATCDNEIKRVAKKYGARVIMTSKKHKMCMERIAEASKYINAKNIITVQGDEPLIQPIMIEKVVEKMKKFRAVTLMQKITLIGISKTLKFLS